jgi:hypothetical protein
MEYKQQTNPTSCYISNIGNFNKTVDGSIYPPTPASTNPEIFSLLSFKPHSMPIIENPNKPKCPRNYNGYSTIKQMCGDGCPVGTTDTPTYDYKNVVPFNNVNYYNCS